MIKKYLRKLKRKLKNTFQAKVPVNNPVLYGELLKGRTALITGGTSGIGYEIAQAFLRNEAKVIITGRNQKRVDHACEKLRAEFPNKEVFGTILDSCKVPDMKASFQQILSRMCVGGYNRHSGK